MLLRVEETITAPTEKVWALITDIENSAQRISGIQSVEVLERPTDGAALTGLKWKETRVMFGKEATEIMWVTEVAEGEFYRVAAESHGSRYLTKMAVEPVAGATRLSMEFAAEPQTFGAKVMWFLTGPLFKGATRKALQKDLTDLKAAAEAS